MGFHLAKEGNRHDQMMRLEVRRVVRTGAGGVWVTGEVLLLHLGADRSVQCVKIHDWRTLL